MGGDVWLCDNALCACLCICTPLGLCSIAPHTPSSSGRRENQVRESVGTAGIPLTATLKNTEENRGWFGFRLHETMCTAEQEIWLICLSSAYCDYLIINQTLIIMNKYHTMLLSSVSQRELSHCTLTVERSFYTNVQFLLSIFLGFSRLMCPARVQNIYSNRQF